MPQLGKWRLLFLWRKARSSEIREFVWAHTSPTSHKTFRESYNFSVMSRRRIRNKSWLGRNRYFRSTANWQQKKTWKSSKSFQILNANISVSTNIVFMLQKESYDWNIFAKNGQTDAKRIGKHQNTIRNIILFLRKWKLYETQKGNQNHG